MKTIKLVRLTTRECELLVTLVDMELAQGRVFEGSHKLRLELVRAIPRPCVFTEKARER